jgi:Flp pilus assembly protein TadB
VFLGLLTFGAGLGLLGLLGYFLVVVPRKQTSIRSLMGNYDGEVDLSKPSEIRKRLQEDDTGEEFVKLKEQTKRRLKGHKDRLSLDDKFFQAGIFADEDKKEFNRLRIVIPIVSVIVAVVCTFSLSTSTILISVVIATLVGLQLPFTILDRKIKSRHEDLMFYLPLVIEQVSIGVSSSLDIGPCLSRIIQMADERDTHNVVTELLRHAQFYVKSGVSLEAAMNEVGKRSGHNELKHAFMSLSQVSKHGGEITRQLQELADAVSGQRETKIEEKIKKLELEATGPVALVFAGFLILIITGFGIQVKNAFESTN